MKILITSVSAVFIILLGIGLLTFTRSQSSTPATTPPIKTIIPYPVSETVDITASFTIITGSITRSFKAEKYHNQSADVYISADDPTVIHVKKKGITYDDFFKTLPMKLTKDCLVTGDGETLCNGEGGTLKFYLNDIETPDLLEKEIIEGNQVLIKFTPV